MKNEYDIIIVGAGPAGISAGIYAVRAGRSVLIIEKFAPGGQLGLIGEIENYAGFEKINGFDLAQKFESHAKTLGVDFVFDSVISLESHDDYKIVNCQNNTFKATAVILALGCHSRELNIEGEKEFKGKGVSYCALCDGNFFRNKNVAVVGSGDSAFSDALYLSNLCNKVYVLTKENLKLNNYAENEFDDKENVLLMKGANSKKIVGSEKVESLEYETNGEIKTINVDGVFVAIGRVPDTSMLKGVLKLDNKGYIETNDNMESSEKGIYACGDVRANSIRQIATAVGDGAIAGTYASKFVLKKIFEKKIKA